MPLSKIEFASGLVKDETALAAEGGYVDANNIRFRQGKPETRGGWEIIAQGAFTGIVRRMHAWADLRGQPQLGLITASKAYALTGGLVLDITPPYGEGTTLDPFTTTNGSPTVVAKIPENGFKIGQNVTFKNAKAVGGLTLNGTYPVASILTRDTFTITAAGNATSAATGGGGVDWVAAFLPGLTDGTGGLGYGTGTYSQGVYGLPSSTDFLPGNGSLDNFGETLLINWRGGPLYAWQPALTYSELMLTGKFAGGTGWTTSDTGGTKVAGTAANLSQNIQNAAQGGATYRVTFTVALTAGTIKLQVNAGTPTATVIDVGSASTVITQSGTYSRLVVMPANPSDLVFAADSAFAGSVTGISLKLENKAFQIAEGPRRIDSMFVDPHRTVALFGTYEADGDYNPLLIRWSSLENYRSWIPDTNNFAGEIAIASGGRIVRAIASRNSNLVWTDAGLHGMQYTADGFNVGLIATGCGALGINAVVEHQGIAYWWSNNGNPYRTTFDFQGTIPQLIDCRIRKKVFDNITPAQADKMYASVNAEFSEIQWFYPDGRFPNGVECNRAAVYQLAENHWTAWDEPRSAWVPAGVFVSPVAAGTDGSLYYHERGITANGNPLPNFLQTGYFDVEDGGNLMQIMGLAHDFARRVGPVDFYIKTKPFPNGPETVSGPYTATMLPSTGTYRDQKLDFRRTGRQMAIRMESTSPWRLGVLRAIAKKSGAVR